MPDYLIFDHEGVKVFKYVVPLTELDTSMFQECGGKAANLGELTRAGFRVPPGFCVKADAYFDTLKANLIQDQITETANSINFKDFVDIKNKCNLIRSLIIKVEIPEYIEKEIIDNHDILKQLINKQPLVAVRSSVAVKNSTISSFPGMMETYHFISGCQGVIQKIKECWASLWTERAAMTRFYRQVDYTLAFVAPIVQVMINSEIAGVMFSLNPITSSLDEIYIESNWGLGEIVVSGQSANDFFLLDKLTLAVKAQTIAKKEYMIVFNSQEGCGCMKRQCSADMMYRPTLNDSMLKELGVTAINIEKHYGKPQDIEWAYYNNELYVLQSRTAKGCVK